MAPFLQSVAAGLAATQIKRDVLPTSLQFLSLPGETPVSLSVLLNNEPVTTQKEYIFITPSLAGADRDSGYPHIFDTKGRLVYYGKDIQQGKSDDFHITSYKGSTQSSHFLFHDAAPQPDGSFHGYTKFFDNTYTQVSPDYGKAGGLHWPDGHEGNVPVGQSGQTLIQDVYQPFQKDLRPWGGSKNGWATAGCFQEIDLTSGKSIFQWCSLGKTNDPVPLNDTYVYFRGNTKGYYSNGAGGQGNKIRPWDYFHFNAAGKDVDGNYIVSSRHTATIYKVAGPRSSNPGSIIWRLGGKNNDFKKDFIFGLQHHCRWHFINGQLMMSLFDNGWDGNDLYFTQPGANYSRGLLFKVDETNLVATLVQAYNQPDSLLCGFAGSVQVQPNSNVFIGWGMQPYVSEHAANGTVLFSAAIGGGHYPTYRAFKDSWVGMPKTTPSVFAYTASCLAPITYVYASWNGATEVNYFLAYVGSTPTTVTTPVGGKFVKVDGFENKLPLSPGAWMPYVKVEYYNVQGTLLGTSAPTAVFVPNNNAIVSGTCNVNNCGFGFDYSAGNSIAGTC